MSESINLSTAGPHSPEYTQQVAGALAEAVRVLNYATRSGAAGLEQPADVYDLLGNLSTTANRLLQLLPQVGTWLQDASAAGKIRVDQGSSIKAVTEACIKLMRAGDSGSLRSARIVYRDLAKRLHPDVGGNADEWEKLSAARLLLMSAGIL